MKTRYTYPICFAIAIMVAIVSCKKDTVKTNSPATIAAGANKQAAISLATSFYKSITGVYGGADIKNGIAVSSVSPAGKRGPMLYSTNPLCGYVVDTATDHSTVKDTTVYHYGGSFSFTYTCSTTNVDGYVNNNHFFNAVRTTNGLDSTDITQQYTVKALDNTYKLVSMDGSLQTIHIRKYTNGPYYNSSFFPTPVNFDIADTVGQYDLVGVIVNSSNGIPDVVSGQALVGIVPQIANKNNTDEDVLNTIYGKITFLGNYIAQVDIIPIPGGPPSISYKVNMVTGQVVN